jgi:uncharacterized damage-inducible protein DinB
MARDRFKENGMTTEQLMVETALASWRQAVSQVDVVCAGLSEEQFLREVAPGRNRILYLMGHLTAVSDLMLTALGLGGRLHPELELLFIKSPDKSVEPVPSAADLKRYWAEVNQNLLAKMEALSPEEWLRRHATVSEEDFGKNPTRNRLNILLSRTRHISYHLGQMALARN